MKNLVAAEFGTESADVAKVLLGNGLDGILITDGYAAYNAVNAKERQTCPAHLMRDCKGIKQEIQLKTPRFQDPNAIAFVDELSALLLKNACAEGGKLRVGEISPATARKRRPRLLSKAQHHLCPACFRSKCLIDAGKHLPMNCDSPAVEPVHSRVSQRSSTASRLSRRHMGSHRQRCTE